MNQFTATVVANQQLTKRIFKLTLFAPPVAENAKPGQFIHALCGNDQSYILRRPFSIHQIIGSDTIDIIIQTIGKGTAWLSKRRPKDHIDLIGPLGHGFDIGRDIERAVIVGGGIGTAPMIFLAKALYDANIRVFALIGAATAPDLLDVMELKRLARKVSVTTEDGDRGTKGVVTDILGPEIEETRAQVVYACGPEMMLKHVAGICRRYGVACQVSLEARMACGIGACLGCAIQTDDGFLNVCSDGPVFSADMIRWDPRA